MNLLLSFPDLPLRIIQLWVSEEENASVTDVNASVSVQASSGWGRGLSAS